MNGMSNIDLARELIARMSGQENYLTINKLYVEYMGSLDGGIFLQQLIFWSDKSSREDGFFYKTYKEWQEEVCLSEYNVRKHTKKLAEKGFLKTALKKANGSPTLHYKFDMNRFLKELEWFLKNLRIESEKIKNGNLKNCVSSITEEYDRRIPQKTTTTDQLSSSSEIFKFYESEFGPLSNFIAEEIGYMIEDTNEELVLEALKLSVRANKRTIKYAAAITRNWRNENIKSIEDLRAARKMKGCGRDDKNDGRSVRSVEEEDYYSRLANFSSDDL